MKLPQHISLCVEMLENAGFATYAVGGCVRDFLLGLTPHDYDLCTAATPEQIKQSFSAFPLVTAGEKHGTVGVIVEHETVEITTFRSEGGYMDGRHPDWVEFVTDIEADLSRRDFTVNAMAWSPTRGLCDPFGGQDDLQKKRLRAVGDPAARFQEDSLRILRGVRFAVRFGLTPEENTLHAMLAQRELMKQLARERVFDELCKLLPLVDATHLQTFAPILAQVIPELAPTVGFDQRNHHHAYDLFTHIAHVTAALPPVLHLRWAGLLHDIGKVTTFTVDDRGCGHFYGHDKAGAELADTVLLRLKAPTALRERVVRLIGLHMTWLSEDRQLLRRRLSRWGEETVWDVLALQEADMGGKGVDKPEEMAMFPRIRGLLQDILAEKGCLSLKDLAVSGNDLIGIGFAPGPALGKTLERLLELVLSDRLPNEKDALLAAAKEIQEDAL
ncbi:MAG: HD domain-containing protein [Oscillospiraceae bacterium]|nr:HD domain-containing protein [Oscillospiraceae bacterium]